MILRPFKYVECGSVDEATATLKRYGDGARIIAGGTALVPLMKHRLLRPEVLVSVIRVPGLGDIAAGPEGGLRLGALATHWEVSRSPLVRRESPLLAYACGRVASPTVRSMATLGGNLCYGESASDPSPALLALRARVRVVGSGGERTLPLTEFFTGFYETALAEDEVLTAVEVPPLPPGARWRYLKWVPRAQEDKALVGLAAVLVLDGRHCRMARLGLGGVASSPMVLRRTEQSLEGRELDERTSAEAAGVAAAEVEPMEDLQGSADYRRDMLRVWVRRVVADLVAGGGER